MRTTILVSLLHAFMYAKKKQHTATLWRRSTYIPATEKKDTRTQSMKGNQFGEASQQTKENP